MIFGDDMPVFELVSDVSEDAVAKFAKNMGYNRYTTNWMDVVTDPEIDLIDIATPNCMHYEMAKAALEHGKHVLCEKPFTINAEQAKELYVLAEKQLLSWSILDSLFAAVCQIAADAGGWGDRYAANHHLPIRFTTEGAAASANSTLLWAVALCWILAFITLAFCR